MKRESETKHPEVIILTEHERVDAEEYVEDADHVYRKKDEVNRTFKFQASDFWLRFACLLGVFAIFIVLILRAFALILAFIFSAFHQFKDRAINKELKSAWKDFVGAAVIITGLAVGVIKPSWGMRFISLFFSLTNQKMQYPWFNKLFRFSGF